MIRLQDVASVLRSKNAGAFVLTIDIIFKEKVDYEKIVVGGLLQPHQIAAAYHVRSSDVLITPYPEVLSLKVTMPRHIGSGDLSDSDVYGAQQHVPLMLLDLPDAVA
ncbi:DUF4387 domain-containing protein [Candidimonas nitroreducens]|uniref:Acyl-CoA synthetase n=1 Tax=Candidimonas nitroreducens TaxID=683354 RepID=A0A225MTV4_9BURK|nr:DUF4387 domain-containing protein [Candidimonas nitroreducens]OWT63893.1 acyl-CoA synthetase [Candidimonas nitroreducens]